MRLANSVLTLCSVLAVGCGDGVSTAAGDGESDLDFDLDSEAQESALSSSFSLVADSWVRSGSSVNSNKGTLAVLYADALDSGGAERRIFLKFNVLSTGGQAIESARVRLACVSGSAAGGSLHGVQDTAWDELALTWNNQPPIGPVLATQGVVTPGAWVEFDVTPAVRGPGLVSFALTTASDDEVQYAAREATAGRPQLVLTFAPPAAPDVGFSSDAGVSSDAGSSGGAGGTDAGSIGGNPSAGILVSAAELARLPTSGAAWTAMKAVADGDLGTAKISDQDNKHNARTLAVALVYARTGVGSYREKARAAIMSAIGTEVGGRVLALGRNLGGYVFAADLIDLKAYSPSDDARFRTWLAAVRTANIGGHGRWYALTQTHEDTANNWGTFAGASRLAASLYLGDTADVQRAAKVFQGWLGDRSAYAGFSKTAGYNATWACDDGSWVPVNPSCALSGINVDGALVEDVSRGGGLAMPPGSSGMSYSWEALQGVFVQAELLYRQGHPSFDWSNKALLRAMGFMQRAGWNPTGVARYLPWMANARYGTSFPTTAAGYGRLMGYTDWLYP